MPSVVENAHSSSLLRLCAHAGIVVVALAHGTAQLQTAPRRLTYTAQNAWHTKSTQLIA